MRDVFLWTLCLGLALLFHGQANGGTTAKERTLCLYEQDNVVHKVTGFFEGNNLVSAKVYAAAARGWEQQTAFKYKSCINCQSNIEAHFKVNKLFGKGADVYASFLNVKASSGNVGVCQLQDSSADIKKNSWKQLGFDELKGRDDVDVSRYLGLIDGKPATENDMPPLIAARKYYYLQISRKNCHAKEGLTLQEPEYGCCSGDESCKWDRIQFLIKKKNQGNECVDFYNLEGETRINPSQVFPTNTDVGKTLAAYTNQYIQCDLPTQNKTPITSLEH